MVCVKFTEDDSDRIQSKITKLLTVPIVSWYHTTIKSSIPPLYLTTFTSVTHSSETPTCHFPDMRHLYIGTIEGNKNYLLGIL